MAQIVKPALRQACSRQVLMELLAHAGGVYRLSMRAREYKPDWGGMWNSAHNWWHANAQAIGTVAGTISMACGVASLAVIDAPITGTCAFAFGFVAMMADVEQGHTDTFTMVTDAIGILPGGMFLGKGASLALRACKNARLAELGATTVADAARDSSTVRRMARVSDDLQKANNGLGEAQAIFGQALWVKQMVGW